MGTTSFQSYEGSLAFSHMHRLTLLLGCWYCVPALTKPYEEYENKGLPGYRRKSIDDIHRSIYSFLLRRNSSLSTMLQTHSPRSAG